MPVIVKDIAFIIGGLLLLYYGGDFLVHGAVSLAKKLKIPTIVIGLTIVAFGTSMPELFVSSMAAITGEESISIGNVVGSNLMNTAFILGIVAIVTPIVAHRFVVVFDMPFMFLSYAALLLMSFSFFVKDSPIWKGVIGPIEGIILVGALVFYTVYLYRRSKGSDPSSIEEVDIGEVEEVALEPVFVSFLKIAGGLAGLTLGAKFLIDGSLSLLGDHVESGYIGLTIAAIGTSLPELATSIVAILKDEMDISLGNIIGSNIFNTLLVIGVTALIKSPVGGLAVKENFITDYIVMCSVGLFLFIFLAFGKKLPRFGGVILLLGYLAYFAFITVTRTSIG